MGCTCSMYEEMRKVCNVLIGNIESKMPRSMCEDNITLW
jgi:hypothetical protein